MSIASRAQHMAKVMSQHSQKPFYDKFRDSYIEADDFSAFDADDDWTATQHSAGTADVVDGAGGILQLDCASTTVSQGINVQRKVATFLPAAGKHIIFEAKVKWTDQVDKVNTFVGLSEMNTDVLDSAANATANHIGIEAIDTATYSLVSEKATVRGQNTSAVTPVEDTYVVVGFFVDGLTSVTPLINGVGGSPIETGSTTTPVVALSPTFVCFSQGSHDPILSIDWYYCMQIR